MYSKEEVSKLSSFYIDKLLNKALDTSGDYLIQRFAIVESNELGKFHFRAESSLSRGFVYKDITELAKMYDLPSPDSVLNNHNQG